jgi:nuclear GTP-binding protein
LINSLCREKSVAVGSTPGLTKQLQLVKLDKQVTLIDSPGVMFSGGMNDEELLLRNCLRVEQLTDPIAVIHQICNKIAAETLCAIYHIDNYSSPQQLLLKCALKQGKIGKGGIAQLEEMAKTIIHDWNKGKIPFHSSPPHTQDVLDSQIISSWAQEFDINKLLVGEAQVRVEGKEMEGNVMNIASDNHDNLYHSAANNNVAMD